MTAKRPIIAIQHVVIFTRSIVVTAIILCCLQCHAGKNVLLQSMVSPNDTIVSGMVKDENGNPIANAKISSPITGDVYTNSDGLFSITLGPGKTVTQSFIFSYDTLLPEIRSYHPVMGNTTYEVVLEPKKCCLAKLLAAINCKKENNISLPSINFKPNSSLLSGSSKTILNDIALTLKDSPELKITVTAYPASNDPKQRISDNRLLKTKEYLMEQMGISSDRIITEKKPGEGDGNVIDFKAE